MISMELQRDVPQYMAIPWLMTWVMARTVSSMGVLGSGRLANTTSTYSSCSRSREALRPAGRSQKGPSASSQTFPGTGGSGSKRRERHEAHGAGSCGAVWDTCGHRPPEVKGGLTWAHPQVGGGRFSRPNAL